MAPLLFLLYINDLPGAINKDTILFADDTTVIVEGSSKTQLENDATLALKNTVNWLEHNNLKVNLTKTNIIHFQTYKTHTTPLNIQFNGTQINCVSDCAFLGITLDKYCNWKPHIEKMLNKIDRFVYVIKKIRQTVNVATALTAYHAYIASVFRYGIIIWGNSVDADRVLRAQKKCIRAICGISFLDTCKPHFIKLKILTVPCLYIYEMCIFVKKYPDFFKKFDSTSRHKAKLKMPVIKLEIYNRNSYCMSIKIYNNLPKNMRLLPLHKFKKELQNLLINKNYYNCKQYLEDKIEYELTEI